jgi:hypothetical protein
VVAMSVRKLIWVEENHSAGWGCSECSWVFTYSAAPKGKSFDELVEYHELQREKAFASHVCAEYPRGQDCKKAQLR